MCYNTELDNSHSTYPTQKIMFSNSTPDPSDGNIDFNQPTPTSFLDELRSHDQKAWERFNLLYGRLVIYWLIQRGVSNRQIRKKMLYDICILVMKSIGGFRKEKPTDRFRSWLHKVVDNYVTGVQRDYQKKKNRPNAVYDPSSHAISDPHSSVLDTVLKMEQEQIRQDDPDNVENLTEDEIYAQGLMRMLGTHFSQRDVDIYYQLVYEKKNSFQVAELTGLKPANIRKIRQRINDYLKKYLAELNELEDDDNEDDLEI